MGGESLDWLHTRVRAYRGGSVKAEIVGSVQTFGMSSMGVFVLALMALVIADIARGEPRRAPKGVWGGMTVFLLPLGPGLYLLWGRRRGHADAVSP